jgi:hypothetical protein
MIMIINIILFPPYYRTGTYTSLYTFQTLSIPPLDFLVLNMKVCGDVNGFTLIVITKDTYIRYKTLHSVDFTTPLDVFNAEHDMSG